jgi:hypothetical protein
LALDPFNLSVDFVKTGQLFSIGLMGVAVVEYFRSDDNKETEQKRMDSEYRSVLAFDAARG